MQLRPTAASRRRAAIPPHLRRHNPAHRSFTPSPCRRPLRCSRCVRHSSRAGPAPRPGLAARLPEAATRLRAGGDRCERTLCRRWRRCDRRRVGCRCRPWWWRSSHPCGPLSRPCPFAQEALTALLDPSPGLLVGAAANTAVYTLGIKVRAAAALVGCAVPAGACCLWWQHHLECAGRCSIHPPHPATPHCALPAHQVLLSGLTWEGVLSSWVLGTLTYSAVWRRRLCHRLRLLHRGVAGACRVRPLWHDALHGGARPAGGGACYIATWLSPPGCPHPSLTLVIIPTAQSHIHRPHIHRSPRSSWSRSRRRALQRRGRGGAPW